MDKETFFRTQPAAARILKRMRASGRLPHALLFWGPRGAPLKEAAEILSQALLCEHPDEDGFGCQTCLACRNARKHQGIGLFWNERLQKKDAQALQEQFSLTSQKERVCVLEHFDEATPQAANALLKFIEEPQPGITCLLTAREKSGVLPTIESRCQCIQLRPSPEMERAASLTMLPEAMRRAAASAGYSPTDFPEPDAFLEKIMPAARRYMQEWSVPDGLLHLQLDLFPAKAATTTREMVRLFMECLLWAVRESDLPVSQKAVVLPILTDGIGGMKKSFDPSLALDQMASRIRKGIQSDVTS